MGSHAIARAQPAASPPLRIAAQRVCSNVEALKTSKPALPGSKTKPN